MRNFLRKLNAKRVFHHPCKTTTFSNPTTEGVKQPDDGPGRMDIGIIAGARSRVPIQKGIAGLLGHPPITALRQPQLRYD